MQAISHALGFQLVERVNKVGYALLDLHIFSNLFHSQGQNMGTSNYHVGEWNSWESLVAPEIPSFHNIIQVGLGWSPKLSKMVCFGWDPEGAHGWGWALVKCTNSSVQGVIDCGRNQDKMDINDKVN